MYFTGLDDSEYNVSCKRRIIKRVRSDEEHKRHNASQKQYYKNRRKDPELVEKKVNYETNVISRV